MRVQLGEKKLNDWANNKAVDLSKSGAVWLTLALDPYHDNPLPPCDGWPDVSTASSVVSCIKQTMQVSATSGGRAAPTENWDLHLALVPDMQPSACYPTGNFRRGNAATIDSSSGLTLPFGGLMARGVFQSGAAVNWMPVAAGSNVNLGNLSMTSTYGSGLSRVIGIGFEVHNTTADLTKQGSVVYYRLPEPKRMSDTWVVKDQNPNTAFNNEFVSATMMRLPPTTVAQAMQLAGSREFKARDGAYIVAAFHSNENPPLPVGYSQPFWQAADDEEKLVPDITNNDNNTLLYVPKPGLVNTTTVGTVTVNNTCAQPKKLFPFHTCGCIFSGLSPTSTFTVNMIYFVESFPSVSNPLTVLATPSARYDPRALEIYSKALSRLPVGVPVKENGLGQWFSDVISDIEPYMTPMLSMLHPAAGAISKGIGVANNTYRAANGPSLLPPPKQKKKTKNKNAKLDNGSRGKKGNIQGPMRQGK